MQRTRRLALAALSAASLCITACGEPPPAVPADGGTATPDAEEGDAAAGAACTQAPQTLARGTFLGGALAIDGARLYWLDTFAGAVLGLPTSGGTPETLAGAETALAGL